jgi:hypothetical protein
MTIRRVAPRKTVERREPPRQSPALAGSNSRVSDILAQRRRRVLDVSETRLQRTRQSEEMVVATPGGGEDMLSGIIAAARNDLRHRRPGQYLHVSDLLYKCQRRTAIIERHNLAGRVDKLSLSDALTFRQGEAIHDVIKERTTLGAPMAIWGKWKCQCGNLRHEDPCLYSETEPEDICEYCGTPTNVYVEVPMIHEEIGVVGTPDLLLYLRAINAFHVSELKSIAPDQFKELVRPIPIHVIQVLFYWYIMRHLGYRLTDKATIFYVTKGYVFKGVPYKEFVIDVQSQLRRLDDYIEDARMLKEARAGGNLPIRTFCATDDCTEAKKCDVTAICFGHDNGTTTTVSIESLFPEGRPSTVRRVRRR